MLVGNILYKIINETIFNSIDEKRQGQTRDATCFQFYHWQGPIETTHPPTFSLSGQLTAWPKVGYIISYDVRKLYIII